jgi:multiple sugar transport system permease protein
MQCKIFSTLAAVVILLSAVSAQEKVTLRLADWADLAEIPLTEQTLAEFKKLYPHIEVLYEPNPGRVYEEKILTALATNEPPDVFLLDSKLIPTFTNKNVLLDLKPFVERLGIDTVQWYPNVFEIAQRGSGLYAFPKGFTPLMVYYNKRILREAGLEPPPIQWTWNDYLEYAKTMTVDADGDGTPDQFGTAFSNHFYYWIPWVWTAGGDVVNPEGTRASGFLDSPETESAIQFVIDLVVKHKVAPDLGSWTQVEKTGSITALFASGRIGMIIDGHWRMPELFRYIKEGRLDVGVAPFPFNPNGTKVNVMYESGWCVPVNARHPEEAVLLAEFMAGATACRIRSMNHLEIPAVASVAEEVGRLDTLGMEPAFVAEIPFCRQPWGSIIERFSQIEWTLQDAVDEVLVNDKPMHETMVRYAERIDGELANIRSHELSEFEPISQHSEIPAFLAGVTILVTVGCWVLYRRARKKDRGTVRTAFTFLAPSMLHLIVFIVTPIVFAAYLSTHRWDIIVPDKPFVGLGNFSEMASDPYFWNALKNTFLYTLNVPIGMVVSLTVALMMHQRLKGVSLLRTLYFLPSVTSFVAIALVWMWIYHPSFGMANAMLGAVGLPPLQWLNSSDTAMMSVILFSIWLGIGYQMVIFLAGLQGIPGDLYEAARIDGATSWQRFRNITLPLLKPTTFFVLVTSFIGSFQVFTSIYVMTAGGPTRSTDVFVYHIYQAAWEQLRMGYASAMSWVLFVIIMIATWIQFKLMGKEVEYG